MTEIKESGIIYNYDSLAEKLGYPQLNNSLSSLPLPVTSEEFSNIYYDACEAALNYYLETDAVGDSGYMELFEDKKGPFGLDWSDLIKKYPNLKMIELIYIYKDYCATELGF